MSDVIGADITATYEAEVTKAADAALAATTKEESK